MDAQVLGRTAARVAVSCVACLPASGRHVPSARDRALSDGVSLVLERAVVAVPRSLGAESQGCAAVGRDSARDHADPLESGRVHGARRQAAADRQPHARHAGRQVPRVRQGLALQGDRVPRAGVVRVDRGLDQHQQPTAAARGGGRHSELRPEALQRQARHHVVREAPPLGPGAGGVRRAGEPHVTRCHDGRRRRCCCCRRRHHRQR